MINHALHPVLDPLWTWTWESSWAASILILLILLIRLPLRSRLPAGWHYWLWMLAVIRLLLPVVPECRWGLFDPPWSNPSHPASLTIDNVQQTPEAIVDSPVPRDSLPPLSKLNQEESSADRTTNLRTVDLLGLFWAAGVVVWLAIALGRHHRLKSWIRHRTFAPPSDWMSLLDHCRETLSLRSKVRLVLTDAVTVPAVLGLIKPVLLVPISLRQTLDHTELRLVFLHELTHVRRRDVAWNWIWTILQALHWFNPLIHYAFRQFRAARELHCDAFVLRFLSEVERRGYGHLLIKLTEQLSRNPLPPIPSLAPAIHHRSELKQRITMIAQPIPSTRRWQVALVMITLGLTVLTFSRAADPSPAPPAPRGEAPPSSPSNEFPEQDQRLRQRRLEMLQLQLDKYRAQVEATQNRLDEMSKKLGPTGSFNAEVTSDTLRAIAQKRLEIKTQLDEQTLTLRQLENLPREHLKNALLAVSPDTLLSSLLKNQAETEQQLAVLTSTRAPDHPEVKSLRSLLDKIDQQVKARLEGILFGMKARQQSLQANLEYLSLQAEELKKQELESTIASRPYRNLQKELENLQKIKDILSQRLENERLEAELR